MELLSAQAVAKKVFKTVRLREGYDPDEVDGFLDRVEATLTELYAQLGELSNRTMVMPAVSTRTAESLVEAAHKLADQIEAEANGRAGAVLADARNQADGVELNAKQQADTIIAGAYTRRDELDRAVTALEERQRAIISALENTLAQVRGS